MAWSVKMANMLKRLRFTNVESWAEADLLCGRITGA